MRMTIDCDTVFERLTSGPFSAADPADQSMTAHLRVCHECRQLAEALRPAVGLLHESLADTRELPNFDCPLPLAEITPWAHPHTPATPSSSARHWLLAGLAAAFFLAALLPGWRNSTTRTAFGTAGHSSARQDSSWSTLRGLPLTTACWRFTPSAEDGTDQATSDEAGYPMAGHPRLHPVAARATLTSAQWRSLCCTSCHHLGGAGPMTQLVLNTFQIACAACHS